MQRYTVQGSGASTSDGSSGRGAENFYGAAAPDSLANRSPRAARNADGLSFMTAQQRIPYQLPVPRSPPGARNASGKRRQRAELSRLNQEIYILREELNAVANTPPTSTACKELVEFMDACIDPLLPVRPELIPAECNRWFKQPVEQGNSCWWLCRHF